MGRPKTDKFQDVERDNSRLRECIDEATHLCEVTGKLIRKEKDEAEAEAEIEIQVEPPRPPVG